MGLHGGDRRFGLGQFRGRRGGVLLQGIHARGQFGHAQADGAHVAGVLFDGGLGGGDFRVALADRLTQQGLPFAQKFRLGLNLTSGFSFGLTQRTQRSLEGWQGRLEFAPGRLERGQLRGQVGHLLGRGSHARQRRLVRRLILRLRGDGIRDVRLEFSQAILLGQHTHVEFRRPQEGHVLLPPGDLRRRVLGEGLRRGGVRLELVQGGHLPLDERLAGLQLGHLPPG